MGHSIPQTDPRAAYLASKEAIDSAIARVMASGMYILGEETTSFEEEFAGYVGVRFGVGVASGTEALQIALRACGAGPGDEVITVSHTAVATVAAIEMTGADAVLAEIDPTTFTIAPESAAEAVTDRTRAVVPVHLYGHPADMGPLIELARRHNLRVVEDCAQAHGAQYLGRKVGSFGDAAAFSFYPTKNLGALGDGGMIVTDDPGIAENARLLRQYGWRNRYVSSIPGWNSRLDELQAAVLRTKLTSLNSANDRRRCLAATYSSLLEASGLELPVEQPWARHCRHQYVIRHPRRNELQAFLKARQIGTLVHYPVPVHLQPAYMGRLRTTGELVHTERAADQVLSLPLYPELPDEDAAHVARSIVQWLSEINDRETGP